MAFTSATASSFIIECIDGKDDHLQALVSPGQSIILNGSGGEGQLAVKEFEGRSCSVIISNHDNYLSVDGSHCTLSLKVNGNPVPGKINLRPGDLLRIGNSLWKFCIPGNNTQAEAVATHGSIREHFNRLIGLEELTDFKLRNIFSNVFKKHSLVAMEDQLVTGTFSNTPAITDIETDWAKPWLFSRLLLASIAISVLLIIGFNTFQNPNLIPGLIFVGAFAVPLSTLIFFLELNAPRNISIFIVMALAFLGGVISLFFALVLFDRFNGLSTFLHASAAGIIEEVAKLAVVILIVGRIPRYRWILNGLLFGAAIGMGFAAFESAGYAFKPILSNEGFGSVVDSIVLRGLLAPFMHIVWTANAAAGLWLVKGERKFEWEMLTDSRFVRVMASSVLLHMTWNSEFSLLPIPLFFDVKYLLLGVIAWIICFRLVQAGLRQLNEARRIEIDRLTAQ